MRCIETLITDVVNATNIIKVTWNAAPLTMTEGVSLHVCVYPEAAGRFLHCLNFMHMQIHTLHFIHIGSGGVSVGGF